MGGEQGTETSSNGSAARRTRAVKVGDDLDESVIQLRLAFLRICEALLELRKDPNDPVLALPSKKKNSKYLENFERPIDLTTIHANADKWTYRTVKMFDDDVKRLLSYAKEFYEAGSEERTAVDELEKVYDEKKTTEYSSLSLVVPDKSILKVFEPLETNELELKVEPGEDIIRCICGLFKDEGLMIECAKCQVSGASSFMLTFQVTLLFSRYGNTPNALERTPKWRTISANVVSRGKWIWRSSWTSSRTKDISTICR